MRLRCTTSLNVAITIFTTSFDGRSMLCTPSMVEVTENYYFPVWCPISFTCIVGGSRTRTP